MEFSSLHLLLLIFLLSLFITSRFLYHQPCKKPPTEGLKPYPIIGNLPQFVANRHRFIEWTTDIIRQTSTRTIGFQNPLNVSGVMTANPLNVEHILKTHSHNYSKGERITSTMEDFLGHGIFNSDGDQWKRQRKAASFEFNTKSLRTFVVDAVGQELMERLLPLLARAGERNDTVDLQDVLERFGFDSICKVAFNEDPACLSLENATPDFMTAFGDAQSLIVNRLMEPFPLVWKLKKAFAVGSERRLKASISVVDDFASKIIRSRRQRTSSHGDDDLLSRFASNEENSDKFLRDIVINFLLAGRETTSAALTWFFWLLSTKPDVEANILQEVKHVRRLHNNSSDTFSFDELREMHYLHAAVTEAMRLYPPVAVDTMTCQDDDVLPDGTFIGRGWLVTYHAYAMGRLEDIWGADCEEYRPERWLEDGVFRAESPFRFPVFHAGPRMCLGKEMAYIQMKSIAASVIQLFEMRCMAAKDKPPELELSSTLKTKGGLQVQVKKRGSNY